MSFILYKYNTFISQIQIFSKKVIDINTLYKQNV